MKLGKLISNKIMHPKNPKIRKFLRKIQRLTEDLSTYIKMSLEEEKIQRVTDFASCPHPVLLIYGFGTTRRIFTILEKRLRKDGYCVFSIHLGGFLDTFNTGGIKRSAKLIEEKVNKLKEQYNLGPLSIIGYSKGGLIGSYYVKFLSGANKVCNLITMGCPHNGTPWALVGLLSPLALFSKSIRQMWPLSPFIRKLNNAPMPEHVNFVSIYSKGDSICPYPCCKLEIEGRPNYKNIEMKDISHSQFVISRSVYEVIRGELEMGMDIPPPSPNQNNETQSNDHEDFPTPMVN